MKMLLLYNNLNEIWKTWCKKCLIYRPPWSPIRKRDNVSPKGGGQGAFGPPSPEAKEVDETSLLDEVDVKEVIEEAKKNCSPGSAEHTARFVEWSVTGKPNVLRKRTPTRRQWTLCMKMGTSSTMAISLRSSLRMSSTPRLGLARSRFVMLYIATPELHPKASEFPTVPVNKPSSFWSHAWVNISWAINGIKGLSTQGSTHSQPRVSTNPCPGVNRFLRSHPETEHPMPNVCPVSCMIVESKCQVLLYWTQVPVVAWLGRRMSRRSCKNCLLPPEPKSEKFLARLVLGLAIIRSSTVSSSFRYLSCMEASAYGC